MTATTNTTAANTQLLAHAAVKTAKESPVDRAIRLKAERELKAQATRQPVAAKPTETSAATATPTAELTKAKRTPKVKAATPAATPEPKPQPEATPAAAPQLTPGQKAIAAIKAKAAERYNAIKDKRVTLLVTGNPKKPGTACYERFAKYQAGQTVEQALAAGVTRDDITWDLRHKFISLS